MNDYESERLDFWEDFIEQFGISELTDEEYAEFIKLSKKAGKFGYERDYDD